MPKQLVIEACIINHGDDRGGVDYAAGTIVEVNKETANTLACAGRTLYIDKKDDPDKNGRNTTSEAMIRAAEAMAKKTEKQTPRSES